MMSRSHARRARGDSGVALVEFAIVAPLLFLLVFGIIEFGWGFGQYLDVRHGAREGARLAAVNYKDPDTAPPASGVDQSKEIIGELCDRMGGDAFDATVTMSFDDPVPHELGDRATIAVESELDTLTGFLDPVLGGITIEDSISFRLERDADWGAITEEPCSP